MTSCADCGYLYYMPFASSMLIPMCASDSRVPFGQGGEIIEHDCEHFISKNDRETIDLNDSNTLEMITLYCKKQQIDEKEFIDFLKMTGSAK